MPDEPNYLTAAFKSQYNLIGVVTALGFAVLSGTALPLLLAAGVELMVLPLVAGNGRFQRLMRARASQDREDAQQEKVQVEATEMLRTLSDFERGRYRQLQQLGQEIRHNYGSLDSSTQMLLSDLETKLDFLLSFYLRMRSSLARYERYFATTDPEQIQERISMLEHEMGGTAVPSKVQQVKARTKAVLEKRLQRYAKAVENRTLIDAQTETVQEVLQLLRDQSYSMRDPRTITEQLDGLVSSAEETERGVRDMEDILSMDGDALLGGSVDDIERELERGRTDLPQPVTGGRPPQAVAPPKTPVPLRSAPPPPPPPPARKKVTH